MSAEAEPLQGNLFEGEVDPLRNAKATEKKSFETTQNLSDRDLIQDSQSRPRKRQITPIETNESLEAEPKNQKATEEEDLPRWSHHSQVNSKDLTPMLRHYLELKTANPERILLYRLGDFFECFFEDAIQLSKILELTLTGKEGGKTLGRVPMAGIPHHAAEKYCAELIRHGLSVALCDQLETTAAKGALLKRDITRVLTPGTVIEEGMLQARRNNWLAAVVIEDKKNNEPSPWGLAIADISTGEFLITQRNNASSLYQELGKLQPSELIYSDNHTIESKEWIPDQIQVKQIPNTPFNYLEAENIIKNQYQLSSIKGLGLNEFPLAIRAAGGLLAYIRENQPTSTDKQDENIFSSLPLDLPKTTFASDSLILDLQTRRNLELTVTQRDGNFHGSLLWAIDRTLTSMGGRCLRRWIEAPLIDCSEIEKRQAIITALVKSRQLRQTIRRTLRAMGDLERLAGRASAGQASSRDVIAIADGLERLPRLAKQLQHFEFLIPEWLNNIKNVDNNLIDLSLKIRHNLIDNPPLSISEGGFIHDGVDPILDGLRNQLDDQDEWLSSQEILERKASGNPNLRLQYHRTFGYFLAVSKAKANQVPEHWIRRQTLANEERFITPVLKEKEGKIFQVKARSARREYEIFCQLRQNVGSQATAIRKAARAVAGLDALASLAEVATINSYCAPQIIDNKNPSVNGLIKIKDCRHPVVEQMLVEKEFKANDIQLGNGTDLIVLTGPNASGKSCYLRQVGLIQILAQVGSWVPAQEARLSIKDRIFTRVGAVDDLAAGQSTFMVEMYETSYILHNATKHSLVLLDEIGRGTATFDGLSIAWAVSEFLAQEIRSHTIFATHYHELNALCETFNNVANFQVLVKETGDSLLFLHEVVPGGASRSYGIEAARLAGVPLQVIKRANEVLNDLQKQKHLKS